jgi:hypothetical protein
MAVSKEALFANWHPKRDRGLGNSGERAKQPIEDVPTYGKGSFSIF